MRTTNDDDFEAYLRGDSQVSRVYRQTASESPPIALDNLIVDEARHAVQRETGKSLRTGVRWTAPAALAATVLLCASLAFLVNEEHAQNDPLVPTAVPSTPAPSMSTPEVESVEVEAQAATPPTEADRPERAEVKKSSEVEIRSLLKSDSVPDSEYSINRSAEAERRVEEQTLLSPADAAHDTAQPMQQRQTETIEITEEFLAYPQTWLSYIEGLHEEGRIDEARTQLKAFRSRYPDVTVPENLEQLMLAF